MTETVNLKGRLALVTGAAGGIGSAIARRLAKAGAELTLWDVDAAAVGKLAADLGDRHSALRVDVTDPNAVNTAAEQVAERQGPPDIVVNSAGAAGATKPVVETSFKEWKSIHQLNLDSVFLVTRRFIPDMVARGWGRIVSLASIAAKEGNANAAAYSSAKAGVVAFTKALGKELATTGVLVNCIAPAAVRTGFFDSIPESHIRMVISKIPMGRFGEPEEIAALTLWLCSDECSFATGAVFDVSGGRATY